MALSHTSLSSALRPALISLFVLGGCHRGCDPDPVVGDPRGTTSPLASVARPDEGVVAAMWTAAAKGWQIEPREVVRRAPRYRVTACPMRYQLRSVQTMEVAPGRPPVGTRADMELLANRDPQQPTRFVLTMHKVNTSRLVEGKRVARDPQPDTRFAPVWLHTSGRGWQEEDGPTSLWSAFGFFPGVSRFFPILPDEGSVGSETAWKIVTHAPQMTLPVEVRRGDASRKKRKHRYAAPQMDDARVRLAGEVRLRATKEGPWQHATILKADWTVEEHTEPPRPRDHLERWHGHYVLLDSGRLLHAIIQGKKVHRWSVRPGESNEKRGDARYEMRLVEACDGLVLPPMAAD
ncbi:MAG: hypothetical protein VB934_00145 [Polyangiaceae bacterium]